MQRLCIEDSLEDVKRQCEMSWNRRQQFLIYRFAWVSNEFTSDRVTSRVDCPNHKFVASLVPCCYIAPATILGHVKG